MRKLKFLFLLCLYSMISIGASAYDFSAVNDDGVTIYYKITSDLTCEVTEGNSEYSGIVNIPASVSYDGKIYSVTSIGDDAFIFCSSLTSVTIPNSVTSIGDEAFYYCSSLSSVTIPNSVTSIGKSAFCDCGGLTSIEIPNSVTTIGSFAFSNCSGLTSVTIGNSVTSIGSSAFSDCKDVKELIYAEGTKTVLRTYLRSITSVTIPNSVTSIGDDAFIFCSSLTSVTIPNSVTSIGRSAFNNCSGLTSVTIPNSVTSIGEYAFGMCKNVKELIYAEGTKTVLCTYLTSITSVTIPNSVTSIGEYAFSGCSGLTSVSIPNSVTSIGDYAFSGCSGLTSIVVDKGNQVYDSREDCNAIIETETNTLIKGCNNTIIPNSVTSIGDDAFYDCSGLTSVTIPNSVTSIGEYAFASCRGLTSITIPNSVTSIGVFAFYGCSSLASVTNLATTPQQITSEVFDVYGTLHVLKGYKNTYAVADVWKNFTIVDDVDPALGIEEIDLTPALFTRDGVTYDLQGKRVERMKQGKVYIHDGRKFIAR